MSENITAFTPPGASYPPYVSINERADLIEITVRSPATPNGLCGITAAISMTRTEFERLVREAQLWLARVE